ncbi:hypothetical protein [Vacuolonema iberomarrocanum]|uniref:hypothetical protein n=1 Tax=Vacuolonema iberomarrocanum TaxID=3454632 RepID=UPI0019E3E65E|nr:hypothetical protein [filamentous cyanobacterium LEGE 07170]
MANQLGSLKGLRTVAIAAIKKAIARSNMSIKQHSSVQRMTINSGQVVTLGAERLLGMSGATIQPGTKPSDWIPRWIQRGMAIALSRLTLTTHSTETPAIEQGSPVTCVRVISNRLDRTRKGKSRSDQ